MRRWPISIVSGFYRDFRTLPRVCKASAAADNIMIPAGSRLDFAEQRLSATLWRNGMSRGARRIISDADACALARTRIRAAGHVATISPMPIAQELVFRKYRLESWPRLAAEFPFRGAEWTEGPPNRTFELKPVRGIEFRFGLGVA
ncbi:hypothetical protein AJ87_39995 [Rhizobium yanglingense]|nr:hypothetical protein AJ87_39995 [Rhizobium yanglingense]